LLRKIRKKRDLNSNKKKNHKTLTKKQKRKGSSDELFGRGLMFSLLKVKMGKSHPIPSYYRGQERSGNFPAPLK